MTGIKISVVAPLYKSAPYIQQLYVRCVESIRSIDADYEIVFVNDASPDDGVVIAKRIAAKDDKVVVVDLARNYGQHRAIMTGLAHSSGDLVFVLDGDLEDEPEWLMRFYQEMQRKDCDVVFGIQTQKKRGLAYRFGRSLFNRVMRNLSDARFVENAVTARLMSRRYVDAVLQFKESEIFIGGIWQMCGFSQVPMNVAKHDRGATGYTWGRLFALAINAITSFSTRPLIWIGVVGVCVCLLAFAYAATIIIQKLVFGIPVDGWASIMAAVLMIGGISILCNGIMALYLAKVFIEVKRRPLAIVKDVYRLRRPRARLQTRSRADPRKHMYATDEYGDKA